MKLTDAEIAELRRLEREATPGPWKGGEIWNDGAWPVGPYTRSRETVRRDKALLAAARNALPALLSEVEESRRAPPASGWASVDGCATCGVKNWPHYDRLSTGVWVCSECRAALGGGSCSPVPTPVARLSGEAAPDAPSGIDLTHLQPGLTSMPAQPGNWTLAAPSPSAESPEDADPTCRACEGSGQDGLMSACSFCGGTGYLAGAFLDAKGDAHASEVEPCSHGCKGPCGQCFAASVRASQVAKGDGQGGSK